MMLGVAALIFGSAAIASMPAPNGLLIGHFDCYPRDALIDAYHAQGMTRAGAFANDDGETFELWQSARGDVALTVTMPGKPTCVLGMGAWR